MKIGIFGLGEAGSLILVDLVATGVSVTGYEPTNVDTPKGVKRAGMPAKAVKGADVVIAVTQREKALGAIKQALKEIPLTTIYVDFSSNTPVAKRIMAELAANKGFDFVDIALMGIVPGRGLRTPAFASGEGTQCFVESFRSLGMPGEYC